MADVIISIRKTYSDLIFRGLKKVEFRRVFPRIGIERIFVYESRGAGMIVGHLEVGSIMNLPLDELWEKTGKDAGITEEEFLDYYRGRERGIGIGIKGASRYDPPVSLEDFGGYPVPQNFIYVKV